MSDINPIIQPSNALQTSTHLTSITLHLSTHYPSAHQISITYPRIHHLSTHNRSTHHTFITYFVHPSPIQTTHPHTTHPSSIPTLPIHPPHICHKAITYSHTTQCPSPYHPSTYHTLPIHSPEIQTPHIHRHRTFIATTHASHI